MKEKEIARKKEWNERKTIRERERERMKDRGIRYARERIQDTKLDTTSLF